MAFVNPQTQQATKSSPDEGPRLGNMCCPGFFSAGTFSKRRPKKPVWMGFIQIHEMFYELESES